MYQNYPYLAGKARLKGDYAGLPPFLFLESQALQNVNHEPSYSLHNMCLKFHDPLYINFDNISESMRLHFISCLIC
jgi:hypothetical protein